MADRNCDPGFGFITDQGQRNVMVGEKTIT